MRTSYLFALLGTTALVLSGCSSVDKVTTSAASSTSDNATTGSNTGDATGNTSATSTGQTITTGKQSYTFNDKSFAISGNGLTQVNVTNSGGGVNVETANVAVNTGFAEMTWADPIEMALFTTSVSGLGTDGLHLAPNFAGYKEYRNIRINQTDAELQIWSYRYSQVGQYSVYFDTSAANNNNVAVFHDGDLTPTSALPAGSATYTGKFGGTAVVDNFLDQVTTINDPFNSAFGTGSTYSPDGTWRVNGDVRVTANFGSGSVDGVIDNLQWRRFDPVIGYITITPGETAKPFHNYTFNANITGNTYTGSASGPSGVVVTGNNAVDGAFYGPNGEETAGVIAVGTTFVQPSHGQSPYEENRRGFITLRGVFEGGR